ncbi:phage major capsid protein [Staphylococcus nepalensis]|uniref:phage major capsid protein n=1 Tax=Staphylococcus nepalensis TaxID=214473 RepID=UPI003CF9DE11
MTQTEIRIDENMPIHELRAERAQLEKRADEAIQEENPEEAMELAEKIEALDERIKELEEKVFNKSNTDNNNEQENRNMGSSAFVATPYYETRGQESEELRSFKHYIETRELSDDIKLDTGEAVVPNEVVTDIKEITDQVTTLADFVNVENVEYHTGTIPILKQDIPALPKVDELEENPQLALAPYNTVDYEIDTHRGFIRLSREVLEDNRSNLVEMIKTYFARSKVETENEAILNQLNKLDEIDAVGIDGIKTALNTRLLPNYVNNVIIMNSTTFNKLDLLKDSNGRYMLQDRVGDAPGKAINGVPVHVVSDKQLPGSKIVIGSLKDAVILFRRSQYTLDWTDYMHFGQGFMTAIRQDCQLMNKEAAYMLNFSMNAAEDTP